MNRRVFQPVVAVAAAVSLVGLLDLLAFALPNASRNTSVGQQ